MKPAFAVFAVLALAACSEPKSSEPSFKTPPAAAPVAPAAPAVDATALSADGWRAFKIGLTPEQVGVALFAQPLPTGEECATARPLTPTQGVAIMLESGKISRISFEAGSPEKTDRGIAVGDAEGKVRAAYPTGLFEEPHKYEPAPAKYLTVWTKPNEAGVRYVIGSDGRVTQIHGGGKSIAYVEGCS